MARATTEASKEGKRLFDIRKKRAHPTVSVCKVMAISNLTVDHHRDVSFVQTTCRSEQHARCIIIVMHKLPDASIKHQRRYPVGRFKKVIRVATICYYATTTKLSNIHASEVELYKRIARPLKYLLPEILRSNVG